MAVKKPLLRPANILKRLEWAKAHVNWTREQWYKVLWTDESMFQVFGTHRRIIVRRAPGERYKKECIVPTMKHGGGSVMIWGALSAYGVPPLKRIHGILNKEGYHSILCRQAVPAGLNLIGKGFVFQQDNDPKHKSNLCKNYLEKKQNNGNFKSSKPITSRCFKE